MLKSLQARLLLVGAIALVPALGFQAYTESQARRTRQQLMEDEALRLVRLVAAEQQRIVEGAEQVLNTLAGAPSVQDGQPELCRRLLANLLEQSPRYINANVLGLDGRILCAPGPFDPTTNGSDRTYFRMALQTGGFAIGDYVIGRGSGQPTLHMAKPFKTRDETVAGVVEVALSIDWLAQQLGHLPLLPGAIVTVADRNGTILVRHPGQERFSGLPLPADYRFMLDGNEVGVTRWTSLDQDRPVVVAYSPPGANPNGLSIRVGLDQETTFAAVTQANRTGLLLIVVGGGLAMALITLAGGPLILQPIDRLFQTADRWRTGDLAARAGLPDDGSEFGRLATAFDRMAATLEARERALRMALESTTEGVIVLDRCWRFSFLNGHAKALIGRGRDLLGQVVWEVFPGLAGTSFGNAYRAAMEQNVPTRAEGYYAPLNGYYEARVYPSQDGVTVFYHDQTEERRIAVALTDSNTRLRLAQEAAGIGIWEYDSLTNAMTWSPEQYRLHGLDPAAGPPTFPQWLELVHPEDRPAIFDTTAAAAEQSAGSTLFRFEFRIRRGSDGGLRWLAALGRLVTDAPGRPFRLIGVNLDVTERRQVEEDLRRTTALLHAIGTCSADPIYAKDAEGRFLFANPAVLAVIGKTADEVIGHSDAEWHHDPEQAAAVMANDRRIIDSGQVERLEEIFEAAGMGRRVFRSSKAPLRMEDGRVLGVVAVSSDVTQLKEAEAALRQSETLLRLFIDRAPAAIAMFDTEMRYLAVSRRFALDYRIADGRPEALVGRSHYQLFPEVPEHWRAIHRRVLAGETLSAEDDTFCRHDGRIDWQRWEMVPWRHADGRIGGALLFSEIVTERKAAELALRQLTTELEQRVREEVDAREAAQVRAAHAERMQALGQLAGGIAHDFNNVLQAIEGAGTLIEQRAEERAEIRRLARVVIEAVDRGTSITRRLLAFGRRGGLRPTAVDVAALVNGLHEILTHTLGAAIDVHVRLEAGLPPLLADKGQLETVLVNLATNARDAMPEGGRLTLSAEADFASPDGPAGLAPGRYIRLAVADTGVGMDAETLAHAGEPFFTTKPLGAGTGLGLPMAKGFARQSGGALRVESSPGRGTRVKLWLPVAAADQLAAPPGAPVPGTCKATMSGRVLVVDDENLVREMLAQTLENAGFTVLLAADGTEALALLTAGEVVDVLVTDLSMPGIDGLAVIRTAQERHPDLPAVLLTGYAAEDSAVIAIGGAITGAFSLLRKPIRAHDLVDRIQTLLAAREDVTG